MNILIPLLITMASLGGQGTHPSKPEATQKCVSDTATILQRIQAMVQADPTFELHSYAQERAVQILDTFNADAPATKYRADQVLTLVDTSEDGSSRALVMLITGGCMTGIVQTPRRNWYAVISKSIGNDT
ncbi:hypothetical protein SAMN05519103_08858 [Rhizobiales bacterium GAS113]|nr:hypothetical protein SAMN05519103_08858 [Rhizobiales bacterium GAS113]